MRPYFAIIADSFRAALASRVLYVLLILITLVLLVIAPLNMRETIDWKLSAQQHLPNLNAVVDQLIEKGKLGKTKSTKCIWNQLSPGLQTALAEAYESNNGQANKPTSQRARRRLRRDLVDELNEIICRPEFYRPEDWGRFSIQGEAKELLGKGLDTLSTEQRRRFNRLLVGRGISALVKPQSSTLTMYYGGYTDDPDWVIPVGRSMANQAISQITVFFFDKLLLSVGILVGIIITANIIPQTFNPGSLNLLLSKPIYRSGLYISRFIGGCSQIAICTTYLFVGTWLWLGLGIGLWDQTFLWSIPIYVLVFAIYFSVSAVVGLLYRSPILSVVATVLFWATCFAVGSSYQLMTNGMQNDRKYDPLVIQGEVLAMDGTSNIVRWEEAQQQWNVIAQPSSPDTPEASALSMSWYFAKIKTLPNRIRPLAHDDQAVYAGISFPIPPIHSQMEAVAIDIDGGKPKKIGKFPSNTMALFAIDDGLLAVNRSGQFSICDPSKSNSLSFKSIGPNKPSRVTAAYSVAMNSTNQELAIHRYQSDVHSIVVYRRTGDTYTRDRSQTLDIGTSEAMTCYLAFAGDTLLVVPGNNNIVALDAQTLAVKTQDLQCETVCGIETIAASPDGRQIAMMYANQNLWLFDVADQTMARPAVAGQGNISSVAFDRDSRLCVFDRESRLTVYQVGNLNLAKRYAPSDGLLQLSYRYLISPLYTIFPKPGELHKVTAYLSSTRNTTVDASIDLIGQPAEPSPLLPLWSGLSFMVFMLGLSCLVFHRQDY